MKLTLIEADNLLIGTGYMRVIHYYFGMPVTEFPQGYEFHVIGPQRMRLYHVNDSEEKFKIMTFNNLPAKNFEVLGSRYVAIYGDGMTRKERVIWWAVCGILIVILINLIW